MKLKVAILEDSKQLLKDLKQNLEETGLVEVVAWATNSDEFLEKVKQSYPDALLLDIDLGGDSMNGLDIANNLRLPVLFVSGKTENFYQGIADHNLNSEYTVQYITKPITIEKLKKILPKFINEIKALSKAETITLNLMDRGKKTIEVDSIVFLTSKGEESNNKIIYFNNSPPDILIDFSFSEMEDRGFMKTEFIKIHKQYRVNAKRIHEYLRSHNISVSVRNKANQIEVMHLPVSENYRKLFL